MTIAIKKELFVCGENDFSTVTNELVLPLAMSQLRGQLTMTKLITVNTKDESKKKGDEVTVPLPVVFDEATNFDPSIGSSPSAVNVDGVKLKLNHQPVQEFTMNDREFLSHASENTIPSAMSGAIDSISRYINKAAFDLYADIYNFSGNLTSLDPRNKASLIALRKEMHRNKVFNNKNLVITTDTDADLLLEMSKVNETGDQTVVNEGFIGRKYGYDIYSDVQAPLHTAGTASDVNGILTTGINLAGSPVIRLSGVEEGATFNRGDIIVVAGGYKASVAEPTVADASGYVEVVLSGGLRTPLVAGLAVEVIGDHPVDLGFTKEAFIIGFRELESPGVAPGVSVASMTDPLTGISLRMLSWYNPSMEKTHYKVECLFGVKTVDPVRACRMGC